MDGFDAEALRRLPLAEAVFHLFAHVLDRPWLDALFDEHRGRCYERELTFADVVHLLRDALLVHGGSGHAAFTAAARAGALPAAEKNVYGKLGRMPLAVSAALVRAAAARAAALMPAGRPDPVPASLAGFALVAVDGKKLKRVAKRLKALRGLPGRMLGGKLLAALDVRAGLVVAMAADPDGERNDVPLVPPLVEQVRGVVPGPVLWLGDRQFGNLDVPALLARRDGDHFLLRAPSTLSFEPDPSRPAGEGRDADGRRWTEQWGWVGSRRDKRRRYVRRVVLERPGEPGGDVVLVTDLLDADAYPAADLLAAYLLRWGIERVFQRVTEVFDLRRLIGSTPEATVFQAAFCLVMYDLIEVVRAHVAAGAGEDEADVSGEKVFEGVRRELVAWDVLGRRTPADTAALFTPALPAAALRARLAALLGGAGVWTERFRKAPPKKARPPTPKARVRKGHGGHTSVWRVLQAAAPPPQRRARS